MLRRRRVAAFLGVACLGAAARAAEAPPAPLIGLLDTFGDPGFAVTLRRHAAALGYSRSDALRFERIEAGLAPALALDAARALVALKPAALVAYGDTAARAAQAATSSISIVAMSYDLVGSGLVSDLRLPGGNLTGVSLMSDELNAKRLELLGAVLPSRAGVLVLGSTAALKRSAGGLQSAAARLGLRLIEAPVDASTDVLPAVERARSRGAQGMLMLYSDLLVLHQSTLLRLAAEFRLPFMQAFPSSDAGDGSLMGYGPDLDVLDRQLVRSLLAVLAGSKAGRVPIEQPTHFRLSVNLSVARQLNIEVPRTLRALADPLFP